MTGQISKARIHEEVLAERGQRYTIAIPEGRAEEEPLPLIVALHWGWSGIVPPFFGRGILVGLVEPALRELGAMIVAPDCPYQDWANPQGEQAVQELIQHLQARYAIDGHKIAITGYSRGAQGTWYMAARNQELFAAALPLAACPPPEALAAEWQIPLYVIHSRDDELMPYQDVVRAVTQLQARGASIEFVLLQGITHFETGGFVEPLRQAASWLQEAWEPR